MAARRGAVAARIAGGLNLTAVVGEMAGLERALLERLSVEGAGRRAAAAAAANATAALLQTVGDAVTVARYLLAEEDGVVDAQVALEVRTEGLRKLTATLGLLRRDNEVRAAEYLAYLDASVAPSDKAVRAYGAAKARLDAEQAAWVAAERARSASAAAGAAAQVASAGGAAARAREALAEDYRVAAAAKRLLDAPSAPLINPAVGAPSVEAVVGSADARAVALAAATAGWTAARAADWGIVSAADEEVQQLREALGRARAAVAEAGSALLAAQADAARAGVEVAGNGSVGAGNGTSGAAGAADALLASALKGQAASLQAMVRQLLQAHHAAQLSARTRAAGGGVNGTGTDAADMANVWMSSPAALANELSAIQDQTARLAAARRVLEDELARRAVRAARGAGARRAAFGSGGGDGDSLPPGGAALLAAVQAAGGVGTGARAADLVLSAAVSRLLAAGGVDTGAGTGSGEMSAGGAGVNLGTGGVYGLGGCEFCAAQRQVARLADEAARLRVEAAGCAAGRGDYTADCGPRLAFQLDRILAEIARRQGILVAEQAELERVEVRLRGAVSGCAAANCSSRDAAALAGFLRVVTVELDTRARMASHAVLRKQYACLWQYRTAAAADVVARVMTEGDSAADASFASSLAFLELAGSADNGTTAAAAAPAATNASSSTRRRDKVSRLLAVCATLRQPAFVAASGTAGLRDCLCTEVEALEALRTKASSEATARAAAWATANSAALASAAAAAANRKAAEAAALAAAKDRLFDAMRSQPAYAKLVSDALGK